jgi:hypothetical protein
MKIGYLFKYRHNGMHDDVTLVILHDYKTNRRFLYNIDYGWRIGDCHIFYAKYIGKASKADIRKYTEEAKAL